MKNKIGFLGVGAAGSNVCDIAELYGYRTSVINTSPEDLEAVQIVQNKLLVGNQGGAGKDRRLAKGEVKGHFEDITRFAADKFKDTEMIYVVFSSGGGTGSGMGPIIIDLLRNRKQLQDKIFGAIVILPAKTESAVAQANNIECIRELVALDIPGFVIDNEKASAMFPGASRKSLYDKTNNYIIDQLNAFLLTKRKSSKSGNLDARDRLKVLTTPGNTVIVTTRVDLNTDGMGIQKQIIESVNSSLFAPLEYDGVVKRFGFIYDMDESLTKDAAHDLIVREIGRPLEVFEGVYTPGDDKSNVIVTAISGLSYPEDRVMESRKVLDSNRDELSSRKEYGALGSADTNWFSGMREETAVKKKENPIGTEEELEDLWSKYD